MSDSLSIEDLSDLVSSLQLRVQHLEERLSAVEARPSSRPSSTVTGVGFTVVSTPTATPARPSSSPTLQAVPTGSSLPISGTSGYSEEGDQELAVTDAQRELLAEHLGRWLAEETAGRRQGPSGRDRCQVPSLRPLKGLPFPAGGAGFCGPALRGSLQVLRSGQSPGRGSLPRLPLRFGRLSER